MNCLVVVAHPLENSLCKYLTEKTLVHLKANGYHLEVKDLYAEGFDPVLSQAERGSYYQNEFDISELTSDIDQLETVESLVLIFPTWWFGFPAILKGWFDRVWAPGHAFDHAPDYSSITPSLHQLRELKVITTVGSPWWVDLFVMRRPVRKILKVALLGACAKNCSFKMLSLYNTEKLSQKKIDRFVEKIESEF